MNLMNGKFSDWVMRIFVLLYACICVWLIIKDSTEKKDIENEMSIITMVNENIIKFENIEFCWIEEINENNKIVRGEDYVCGQRVSLDLAELKQILDKDYYIETENNTALGLYRPIAMLNFNDELGNIYSVFYSFLNAEVRFYQNAKISKVAMMYDSDHILGIFNKLN